MASLPSPATPPPTDAPPPASPPPEGPSKVSVLRKVMAVVLALSPGMGTGLLVLGRPARALVWATLLLGAAALALPLGVWGYGLVVVLMLGSIADTVQALRRVRALPRPRVVVAQVVALVLATQGAALWMRQHLVEPFRVPSVSMWPSLHVGDQFSVDKRRPGRVGRGDVVVYRSPTPPEVDLLKRVVALEGDVVALRDGRLELGGRPLAGPSRPCTPADGVPEDAQGCALHEETLEGHRYSVATMPGASPSDFPGLGSPCPANMQAHAQGCVVPPGHVFVLGDSRSFSHDSRFWGALPTRNIKGRARSIHFSLADGRVRWERLGLAVP